MNGVVVPQCDFCFCELKPRFHNSSICERCIASPLPLDAITSLVRYPHCNNCDKLLCPFHLSAQYLSQELCKTCYGITIRRAMMYNFDYDSSDEDSFPLPWPLQARLIHGVARGDDDSDEEEEEVDYPEDEDMDGDEEGDGRGDEEGGGRGDEEGDRRGDEEGDGYRDEEMRIRAPRDDGHRHRHTGGDEESGGGGRVRVDRYFRVVDVATENTSVCPICLESLCAPPRGGDCARINVALNCHATHLFHLGCATTWLSKNAVCPLCCKKLDAQ